MWIHNSNLGALLQKTAKIESTPPANLKKIYNGERKQTLNEDRKCPACSKPMNTINYGYDSNIFLDRCNPCDSVWIDAGEFMLLVNYSKGNPQIDRTVQDSLEYNPEFDDPKQYADNLPLLFRDFLKVSIDELSNKDIQRSVKMLWLTLTIVIAGLFILYFIIPFLAKIH